MLALYLINWGCNPFLEQLAWFMTKFMPFKDCDFISDMAALTLTLNVNETLHLRLQQ